MGGFFFRIGSLFRIPTCMHLSDAVMRYLSIWGAGFKPISFLSLFLQIFLPFSLLLVGGAVVYGRQAIERELTLLFDQESSSTKLGAGALANKIEFLRHDLTYLSKHSAMRDAINQPTSRSLAHLAEDFAIFSSSRGHYDQIRWLNQSGMEVVRVDYLHGNPMALPTNKLQNKWNRYYFTDSTKLNLGEIFVSPLDLNIEQNKIEVPYKPMMRITSFGIQEHVKSIIFPEEWQALGIDPAKADELIEQILNQAENVKQSAGSFS